MREMLGLTTDKQPLRLPLGRRALREPGAVRNGGAPLPLHRRVGRRLRPGLHVRRARARAAADPARLRHPDRVPIRSAVTRRWPGQRQPARGGRPIRYTFVDGPDAPDGTLVYMKATLSGDEPVDVWNFAKSNPTFPHDPTSDQFFDEARFESYRSLGFHTVKALAGRGFKRERGVKGFCDAVRRTLAGAHASPSPTPVPLSAAVTALGGPETGRVVVDLRQWTHASVPEATAGPDSLGRFRAVAGNDRYTLPPEARHARGTRRRPGKARPERTPRVPRPGPPPSSNRRLRSRAMAPRQNSRRCRRR